MTGSNGNGKSAPGFPTPPEPLDSLSLYLEAVNRTPQIEDAEEERRLARRAQAGDEEARRRLAAGHMRFVIWEAKKWRDRGLSLPDLISAGNEGLMVGIERWDPEAGVRLPSSTAWACCWGM